MANPTERQSLPAAVISLFADTDDYCLLDRLPLDIIAEIAASSPKTWGNLCCAYRRFAEWTRTTAGQRRCWSAFGQVVKTTNFIMRYLNNVLHDEIDIPAVVSENQSWEWYRNGRRHRGDDLPAIVLVTGVRRWYIHGKEHRDGDRPASIDWSITWCKDNMNERDGIYPAQIFPSGDVIWYNNDSIRSARDATGSFYHTIS